jgi:hypothetical protein
VISVQQDAFCPKNMQFSTERGWKFRQIHVIGAYLLIASRERQDENIAAYAPPVRESASGDLALLVPLLS